MCTVRQRTSSRATGWGPTERPLTANQATATVSTTPFQVMSRFISPSQARVRLADITVTLCPLNINSSLWSTVTLTSEVRLLSAWLFAYYCFARHHCVVVKCLIPRIVLGCP